ncbi:hypothetical protein CVT24_007296 [Panaeolus cyanescens]|uniref:N-acetyl-D-glucosamine kinase n=1 Tax=Panaeolus cyanescens TaxID=181874 RepID=A0A409VJ67_9AGAR|nr:hypothetical protein CVT24_007296 [Panaeolus cyanescens]
MSLYLCVDCGGTKTSAAITDGSGTIVGRGASGPSNITYLSVEAFTAAVTEAVTTALKSTSISSVLPASIEATPFAAAWFGISGADSPAAIAKVQHPLSVLLGIPVGPNLTIANDTHLLAAPVRMHSDINHAIAVIAGTGSIAVSFRELDGKIEELGRIGGWGWILGDEGGGFDVGRETLRQILLQQDKATISGQPLPPSSLRDRVLERFGVDSVMEVLTGVYASDPSPGATSPPNHFFGLPREKRISSLPPLVFKAAFEDQDPLALTILKTSAGHLVSQVAILLENSSDTASGHITAPESVISFGGSLVGIESYRNLILDDLAQRGHVFKHVTFIDDAAAVGAIGLSNLYSSTSSVMQSIDADNT